MLAAVLLPCFRERLGLLFLWLISIASVSFYLLTMATSGERNVINKKRLESSSEVILFNYSVQQFTEGRFGYVLASHYSDVFRGSAINLQSLQCWASSLPGKIRVVEPFLRHDYILGVNLTSDYESLPGERISNSVEFTQVYDRTEWFDRTSQHGYAPLVSWSYFIKHAPRKLILVDKSCDNNVSQVCMQCGNGFYKSDVFHFSALEFTRQHGFTIVRRVCYGLMPYSSRELQSLIYGPYEPDEVTVLFNHFGGFVSSKDNYRIQVHGHTGWKCKRQMNLFPSYSDQINKEAEEYVNTFMPGSGSGRYLSVVLYMQNFLRSKALKNLSVDQQMRSMLSCIHEITQKVEKLKKKKHISSVVLSSDVGKYSSTYISSFKKSYMKEQVCRRTLDLLYSRLIGDSDKFDDGSVRLESVSLSRNPAYIAMLEKKVLTSGECLVVVGKGEHQLETDQLFQHHYQFQKAQSTSFCGVHRVCTDL